MIPAAWVLAPLTAIGAAVVIGQVRRDRRDARERVAEAERRIAAAVARPGDYFAWLEAGFAVMDAGERS